MIFLLNGPPRCGKDTVADIIFKHRRDFYKEKFASALKDITHVIHGLKCKHDSYEAVKDKPCDEFNGKTPRQAYIDTDRMLKAHMGEDYLGQMLCKRLESIFGHVVISDSGFQEEAWPLIDHVGPHNIVVIAIKRKGRTFKNDSRSYWKIAGIMHEELSNNGTLEDLERNVKRLLAKYEL